MQPVKQILIYRIAHLTITSIVLWVQAIHAERKAKGLTHWLGADHVRNLSPFDRAGDTFPTFKRKSVLAHSDPREKARLEAEYGHWRDAYQFALEQWTRGQRDVRFPLGTYQIVRQHHALVVDPG